MQIPLRIPVVEGGHGFTELPYWTQLLKRRNSVLGSRQ